MDFVLESGSGDPEQLHAEDSPSPDTGSIHPQESDTIQSLNGPTNHHLGYDENRYTRLEGANTGARPRTRSWPLRDPEEAHLLKHFVDQIASFVSSTWNYLPEKTKSSNDKIL